MWRKYKHSYNMIKIKANFYEDQYTFTTISWSCLLRMSNVSDKFVEKIKTRIVQ